VIKAAKTAPREGSSPRNGLPEPVLYVYREQGRRNTYAARIARRTVERLQQPPALMTGADEVLRLAVRSSGRRDWLTGA
jgi:hypothetical protein